jgi:YidC/Oxa1 family membrane protein insertase
MDNRRLILFLVLSFSLIMLWENWQKYSQPKPPVVNAAVTVKTIATANDLPAPTAEKFAQASSAMDDGRQEAPLAAAATTTIETDLFLAEISSRGGDITRLILKKHLGTGDKKNNFVLFDHDETQNHVYLAQSGAIGDGLPNHRTIWRPVAAETRLKAGEDRLRFSLESDLPDGKKVVKTYIFHRGSYLIDIQQTGLPGGAYAYYQFMRDGKPMEGGGGQLIGQSSTFTGPAVFTEGDKFQKVKFADIAKGTAKFSTKAQDGWLAMIQHYFVAAWLPSAGVAREFYMRQVGADLYATGVIVPVGADGKSEISLYAGPQEVNQLKKIAPGLELVVDYGWLTVIAVPLFWVLGWMHQLTGNWGWAIVGLTVLLKLLFFPLSATSYKSMAKMRKVMPRLTQLKEAHGNDKMRLNQEMMALYKKENINPLGGCLPILVQIPVFIALYWVLQGAVEMRHAPWIGWITDLSAKDPYYVLPLLMGVTMFIQTKLNPAPPDPMQAKVMLFMPILFTGMFLFFPAGLVLYWTVNNLLSIAQQWQITRMIEAGGKPA